MFLPSKPDCSLFIEDIDSNDFTLSLEDKLNFINTTSVYCFLCIALQYYIYHKLNNIKYTNLESMNLLFPELYNNIYDKLLNRYSIDRLNKYLLVYKQFPLLTTSEREEVIKEVKELLLQQSNLNLS